MSKARIQDLTDEQFEEWAKRMIDEAGRRGIGIKGTDAIYWKRISKGNIGALIKLRQGIGRLNQNDVHIAQDIELTYSERANFSTLRQHGLVAHVKDDDGNRVSGRWLLTKHRNCRICAARCQKTGLCCRRRFGGPTGAECTVMGQTCPVIPGFSACVARRFRLPL